MVSLAVLALNLLPVSGALVFVMTIFAAFEALPVFHTFSRQVVEFTAIEALLDSDFSVWLAPYFQVVDDYPIANEVLLVRFFVNHDSDGHRRTFVGSNCYSFDA